MTFKIWSKQLLYIKPDPSPYLLAARTPAQVRLLCSPGTPLYWTNSRAIIKDDISNTIIGTRSFELSAYIMPASIKDGTVDLLDVENLVSVKAQSMKIAFKFPWLDNIWRYTNPVTKEDGVVFRLTGDGIRIKLYIDNEEHILLDTSGAVVNALRTDEIDAYNTQETDELVYPTIKVGTLNVLLPWQYINRIKAEYVEV